MGNYAYLMAGDKYSKSMKYIQLGDMKYSIPITYLTLCCEVIDIVPSPGYEEMYKDKKLQIIADAKRGKYKLEELFEYILTRTIIKDNLKFKKLSEFVMKSLKPHNLYFYLRAVEILGMDLPNTKQNEADLLEKKVKNLTKDLYKIKKLTPNLILKFYNNNRNFNSPWDILEDGEHGFEYLLLDIINYKYWKILNYRT